MNSRKQIHILIWLIPVFFLNHGVPFGQFTNELSVNRIDIKDGLSQNSVTGLLQDRSGFLWITTMNGLNRFDGYDFVVFRHHDQDTTTISSSSIWTIFEARHGYLWIGTLNAGLNRLNPKTNRIQHFYHDPDNSTSLSSDASGFCSRTVVEIYGLVHMVED